MSIADVLSIQLYTMRSMGDLDRILDAVAKARLSPRGDGRLPSGRCCDHQSQAGRPRPEALVQSCQPRRAARAAGGGGRGLPDAWLRPVVHAGGAARSARHGRPRAGARSDASWARWPSDCAAQGIELGYHNHHWELRPKERCQDRARTALRGRRGQPAHLGGGRGLAGARRRRPEGVARSAIAAGSPRSTSRT